MNTRLAPLAAAVFLATSLPAGADQHCSSGTFSSSPTNWKKSATVQQFDPALGVLTGITVTFQGNVQGSVGIESLDAAPALTTTTYAANIALLDYSSTPVVLLSPSTNFVDQLSAFDGVIDFAGTSGVFRGGIMLSGSGGYAPALTPANLAAFVGNGTVPFTATAVGASVATGPGNVISQFLTSAGASVTVCYDYQPDCDGDGISDADEIAAGASDRYGPTTCVPDGIPDACQPQPDCDADGIPDRCEILAGAPDRHGPDSCNPDGIPDSCQPQADCDNDGNPDRCEPDSDGDGIPNDCDQGGTQGCTPGYWKNHPSAWAVTGYSPNTDFDTVFGVNAFNPNIRLIAAAGLGGGGLNALARHAVAALLSSAHPNVAYPITPNDVITLVRNAIQTGQYEATKNLLASYNELGCPL